jgi:hypothetical protein
MVAPVASDVLTCDLLPAIRLRLAAVAAEARVSLTGLAARAVHAYCTVNPVGGFGSTAKVSVWEATA